MQLIDPPHQSGIGRRGRSSPNRKRRQSLPGAGCGAAWSGRGGRRTPGRFGQRLLALLGCQRRLRLETRVVLPRTSRHNLCCSRLSCRGRAENPLMIAVQHFLEHFRASLNRGNVRSLCSIAFSSREPVSTSFGNGLVNSGPVPECHRAHVRQAPARVAHCPPLRQSLRKRPRCHRSRRSCCEMAQMSLLPRTRRPCRRPSLRAAPAGTARDRRSAWRPSRDRRPYARRRGRCRSHGR